MKIVKPVNKNDMEFHQVIESQIYEADGRAFMKLPQFNSHMTNYNTVNLTTGKFSYTSANRVVRVYPNAELHLK